MTDHNKHRSNVHCPRCHTLLTKANRIPKNILQAIVTPKAKRYRCDICRHKFTIMPGKLTEHSPSAQKATARTAIPPRMEPTPRKRKRRPPPTPMKATAPNTRRRASTVSRRKPSPGKAASGDITTRVNRQLAAELRRLRKIEKKYHQLKKANRYLAKACRRGTMQQRPAPNKRPAAAHRQLTRVK